MISLSQLIKKYGEPSAIIDHWDEHSKRFAIWGFEEVFIRYVDDTPNMLKEWQSTIDRWKQNTSHPEISAIGGFSYDLRTVIFPHIKFKNVNENMPVIWFGKPKKVESFDIVEDKSINEMDGRINLKTDIPPVQRFEDDLITIKYHEEIGDIYQINYTHPKLYDVNANPFSIYQSLRNIAKPLCGVYINTGDFQFLSASPERFFNTNNGKIFTYPIKGTRKRIPNIEQDEKLKNELYNSEKDRAEHLMIVDLLRNDIGKVCEFGSVETHNLFNIHSYETVHHMVTKISGTLQQNIQEFQIVEALFPGGSITGAPKERAMEIIDNVEDYSRNFYTGAFGYITPNGNMDLNIAIRTLTIHNGQGVYPVGGGIVWDSDPQLEWEEAHHKCAIIEKLIAKTHNLKTEVNVKNNRIC
jgi:anthranilate/para-aminobenzoate synthase component I